MKGLQNLLLASVFVTGGFAAPRRNGRSKSLTHQRDETPSSRNKITAFIREEDGSASVECWQLNGHISSRRTERPDGSYGVAYSEELAQVDSVKVEWFLPGFPLPIPPYAIIAHQSGTDEYQLVESADTATYIVQDGAVAVRWLFFPPISGNSMEDSEVKNFYFDSQNGDDWFLFQDKRKGDARWLYGKT
ncbi:hypothetical protein B0J11DRAFT_506638 [Dendryphion nanum]|uniref:Uncharacterized protein n=1 Tax=Dendryphion nanum TaxID=256645 RepID=A0A9P9DR85_9PLEO|nr:hypothetical protein B0J11DRAFT_506638 [Dendryphion nanum]